MAVRLIVLEVKFNFVINALKKVIQKYGILKKLITKKEYGGHYRYEDEIWEYIRNLPIQSQELFHNECGFGCDSGYTMEAQDWIDYHLDILPHEKCKEYGLYSPQERQAYKYRFPTCNKVYKKVYSDGSSGCYCDYGAFGDSDGNCDLIT